MMTKLKLALTAFAASLLFVSCNPNNGPGETPERPDDTIYTGTFIVAEDTDTELILENAQVKLTLDDEGTTAQLDMLKVKFAEKMPQMDIAIPGVELTKTSEGYSLGGEDIVPTAMGGPFPSRTVTGLSGVVTAETMFFSMMCGDDRLSFTCIRNKQLKK